MSAPVVPQHPAPVLVPNDQGRVPTEEEVDAIFKSFPAGYRFKPRDEELVVFYLRKKLFNEPLPLNRIKEVQLYKYNPQRLAEENESYGEGEWYFFTPRDKKYPNGSRPRRSAGEGTAEVGYWKATGADRALKYEGAEVGFRKALVFYNGKPPAGEKTDWMMHEFRLKDPPAISTPNKHDMRLDDWVLCKLYKKTDKSIKASGRYNDRQQPDSIRTQKQASDCIDDGQSDSIRTQKLDSGNVKLQADGSIMDEDEVNTLPNMQQSIFRASTFGNQALGNDDLVGDQHPKYAYYDEGMLEPISSLFLDPYNDENLMAVEPLSAKDDNDNLDQFVNIYRDVNIYDEEEEKLSNVSRNFEFSPQLYYKQHYPY